jgi:hypothetical protein
LGNSTSALAIGGFIPPISTPANVESWNGTSWTEVNDLNTGRDIATGFGTSSSIGLSAGGRTQPGDVYVAVTEYWDGTSWTEVADIATARGSAAQQGIGTSTSWHY